MSALARSVRYLGYARVQLATAREYGFDFLGTLALLPAQVFTTVVVWSVIYSLIGRVGSYSLRDMLTYQLLAQAIMAGTGSVGGLNYRVWSDINNGNLSVFLSRPVDYRWAKLASECGQIAVPLGSRLVMFLVASAVLRLPMQRHPVPWLAFLVSLTMALLIQFSIQLTVGLLSFWTERIYGVRDLIATANQLLSGMLLPVSVLPPLVRSLSSVLPFQFTLFVPISVYLGRPIGYSIGYALAAQAGWLAVMMGISHLVWHYGVSRYEAQGG